MSLLLFTMISSAAYSLENPPKIGVMMGSSDINSGDVSSIGKMCIVQAIGDRTGVDFQVYENHRSQMESALAAQKMVSDGVDLALLPVRSDEASAAIKILENAKIPYLTSATSDSVISSSKDGLSIFPRNSDQAETMANYYFEHFNGRPLSVIVDEGSLYSKQLSDQFIGNIHLHDSTLPINEYRIVGDSLPQLPNMSGRVVFAAIYNPKIALLFRRVREDGNVTILGTDSVGAHREFLRIVGTAADNNGSKIIFLKNWNNQATGPYAKDFKTLVDQSCARRLKEADFGTAFSYDIASLAAEWALSDRSVPPLQAFRQSQRTSIFDGQPFVFSDLGYRKAGYVFYEYSKGDHAIELP